METLASLLLCYLGLGVLACSVPRDGDWSLEAQWSCFRETFRDVLTWPAALWREFGTL